MKPLTTHLQRWRYWVLIVSILSVMLLLISRVVFLHVYNNDFLQKQGDARTIRKVDIPVHRGMILDRNGEPLAVSTPIDSVWVNPKELDVQHPEFSELLHLLEINSHDLLERLNRYKEKEFLYLKRHISPALSQRIRALDIRGVALKQEFRRFYPDGEVMAHAIGLTNIDDQGQEGFELAYNDWLSGRSGVKRVLIDRLGREIKQLEILRSPKPGKNLSLSVDRRIQYLAYRELKKAVQAHKAESGTAVMLDVETGEVLAIVNQPSFNPNTRFIPVDGRIRNRAVTDVFEPGSTVKPFAIAAAISQGGYTPSTLIDTHPGWINVSGNVIRDVHNYGVIDIAMVIQKSSNVGMTKVALSLPEDALWRAYQRLGFGLTTLSGFPGESSGQLVDYHDWSRVKKATVSYGYGFSVTALQLARAYAILGAYGQKREISFLKQEKRPHSERVLPIGVSKAVLSMLHAVVEKDGTGTRAKVAGYQIGGKTGTVRKVGPGGYSEDSYLSVFAGLAPMSDPKLALVVVVNDPQGESYYGGTVAAPVFSNIMSGALRILNVSPDDHKPPIYGGPLQLAKWQGDNP